MGWANFFVDGCEGALNSATESIGLGDASEVKTTLSSNSIDAASGASGWWEKGIQQMMPSIMGAAMKPKPQQHATAAPGGHGVQVNTSGMMKPFDEVRSMADDNPLSGIHQWSNLFG